MIPEQSVLPESLHEIRLPTNLAIEFHRRERAALEEDEDSSHCGLDVDKDF